MACYLLEYWLNLSVEPVVMAAIALLEVPPAMEL
jgi:hypothetical protein